MTAPVLVMAQDEIDADRDGWLARRRKGITGTEVAQLLGISAHGSPFSLYHAKIDGTETEDKPAMQRGRHLEPVVEDMAADRWPWLEMRRAGLYAHGGQPWRLGTLDRWVIDTEAAAALDVAAFRAAAPGGDTFTGRPMLNRIDAAVPGEIKTWASRSGGSEGTRWGEPGTDDVPVGIRAQGLWNMDVAGADRLLIPVLFMDRWVVELYELRRDEAAQRDIDLMVAEAERFLHRVACRDEPEPDDHPATTETLRKLHPSLVDESVRVPVALWRRYHAARAAQARAEARVRGAQNDLRHRMGPAARAHVIVPDAETGEPRAVKVVSRSVGDHPVRAHTRHDDKLTPGRITP